MEVTPVVKATTRERPDEIPVGLISGSVTLDGFRTEGGIAGINVILENNVIINNTSFDNVVGIYLNSSSNNTLNNNTVLNNKYGIFLVDDSNNNYLDGNTASNNDNGIFVYSSNNTLSGNNVSLNKVFGLFLSGPAIILFITTFSKITRTLCPGAILKTTGILPKLQALTLLEVLTSVAIFGRIQWTLASVKYVQITTAMEYAIHLMIFMIPIILTTATSIYLQQLK